MACVIQKRFDNTNDQVRMAILWAYGRPATNDELRASAQFFEEFQHDRASHCFTEQCERLRDHEDLAVLVVDVAVAHAGGGAGASGSMVGNQTPLSVFCQTLMASASFRILN